MNDKIKVLISAEKVDARIREIADRINEDYKGKVLTFDVDDMDFENNPDDFAKITDRIDSELYGLFPEKIENNI